MSEWVQSTGTEREGIEVELEEGGDEEEEAIARGLLQELHSLHDAIANPQARNLKSH